MYRRESLESVVFARRSQFSNIQVYVPPVAYFLLKVGPLSCPLGSGLSKAYPVAMGPKGIVVLFWSLLAQLISPGT